MKTKTAISRIIFIINLGFIGFTCSCQDSITKQDNNTINSTLDDTSLITIITPRILRYLPYSLQLNLKDTSNILIEGRNIAISRDHRNLYRMNVGDSGYYGGQLSVYRLIDGNKTRISQTNFKVYEVPITLCVGDKKPGSFLSLEEMKRQRLTASIDNYDIGFVFPIKSFKLAVVINDTLIEIEESSNRINEEQLGYIGKLKEGHPIIFKDIVIEKQNGGSMQVEPLVFFFKSTIK